MRKNSGITLIALVITIIIIIILATITINFAFGDNGLINMAEEARDLAANSTDYESNARANLVAYMNEYIAGLNGGSTGGGTDEPEEPFEPGPTPEPPTGGTEMEDMTNGIIEIKWLEGTSDNVTDTPNALVIKTEGLPSGTTMEQVVFNETSKTWEAGTEYSYIAGTGSNDNTASKWANARVTINGVESYFVWIPRYAYRIIYFDSADSKKAYQEGTLTEEDAVANGKIIGYSDSRGIVDAQGKRIESVTSASNTTHTMVSEDYFMVHPAFSVEVNDGGWSKELAGIWIGKFETSSVEGNSDSISGDNTTTKTVKVQPGEASWRNITIGNMYTNAYNYARELESHMLKNSEWGAVAYLTESKYGRNGTEVTQNTNEDYLTGGGEGTAYAETNTNQSSTGNVYGVYDLNGGAYEYVASYLKNGNFSNASSSTFTDNTSDAYSTAYETTSASTGYKYGDATYETSGWHSGNAVFVDSDDSFFVRGGAGGTSAAYSGILYFNNINGSISAAGSFRVTLCVE